VQPILGKSNKKAQGLTFLPWAFLFASNPFEKTS